MSCFNYPPTPHPQPRHYQAEKLGNMSAAKKYMLPSNHYGGALVLTEDDGEFSVSREHPGDESGTCSCLLLKRR